MRYFFHLHNDIDVRDDEGVDLPDLDTARRRAVQYACEMAAESVRDGHLVLSHSIEVTDEAGDRVFSLSFADAVQIDR